MKKLLIIFILFLMIYGVYSEEKIRIAASANLIYVIEELKKTFEEQNPEIKIDVITASSGKLTAQIINGAPFDIFLSADMKYPEKLIEKGIAVTKPKIYARGKLIIFTIHPINLNNPENLLTSEKIKTIAIANPELAPYGKAAKEYFINKGIFEIIRKKLIYGENINQTIHFSMISADAGIIPASAVFSDNLAKYNIEGKYWIEINEKYYKPIEQGAVILKYGKDKNNVKIFYDFLFSKTGKNILSKYGYTV